jgi:PAS domain S-box-containing protein
LPTTNIQAKIAGRIAEEELMEHNATLPEAIAFEELRAREEHLRLAQEAGGIGTWEWDLATGRMLWSAQMFRNLGLEPREGGDLYRVLIEAVHPSGREHLESSLAEFRTRPGPVRLEIGVVWPGDDLHRIELLGKVVADPAGIPVRMLGITIDGTDRRRDQETVQDFPERLRPAIAAGKLARSQVDELTDREDSEALRDSERRLRQLNETLEHEAERRARQLDASRAQLQAFFDNSPDWLTLFRTTADGHFIYEDLNRATERAYGMTRDQVIGRKLEDILGLEAAQLPLRHMRACISSGENQRYTARRTMAGVTRTIDVMFVRVPEKQDGEYIIATARDITEREIIEGQLRQAQKMETLGQLTGGLAHDFNNLLTAIIGNLELLTPRVANDPVGSRYVAAAQRAAENGARLTEQLLAFSRRQHLQPRAVDLNSVIGGMSDLLTRTIGPTIQVRTKLATDLWLALVDPTQIEIAILNLAINSRDAMPSGGTLAIETRNRRACSDAVPSEIGDRDCISISVRDTGTGMTDEVLRSAVEPFFTTKEVGKGSGLGLSQVYGVVRQSDGSLQIESQPGAGTTVHLYLPRAAAPADASPGDLDHAGPAHRGGDSAARLCDSSLTPILSG